MSYHRFSTKALQRTSSPISQKSVEQMAAPQFPHLFDSYDTLSDKPSQASPLDFAPPGLITPGKEVTTFTEAAQSNRSAPPYTTGIFFPKSD